MLWHPNPVKCFTQLTSSGVILIAFLASAGSSLAELSLIPRAASWKFHYNGALPTNWMQLGFDDRTWASGPGQLGYGDGDEQTLVIDDPGYEPPTTYYRHIFTNPGNLAALTLRMVIDDGAVVYLNGAEIIRNNMPAGPVNFETRALTNIETNENRVIQWGLFSYSLRPNTNIIAVEVHQHASGGQDCSFELELLANVPSAEPLVEITAPADAAVLSGPQVRIDASASDADGHVTRVEFYTNGVFLGLAAAEPFSFIWTNPAVGRYALRARAIDNFGMPGNSELVRVQIGDSPQPLRLLRGPYLQSGTASSMVVRWRTDWYSDSIIRFGTDAASLDQAITNQSLTVEHEFNISGLQSDTVYYYCVGSISEPLQGGGLFSFRTSPTNARPVRIWVIGDSGTSDANAAGVRDAYYETSSGKHTDLWLMLGDNAYGEDGSDDEYQRAVFNMYPELLRRSVLWPTIGNHDAGDSPGGSLAAYLNMFTLPTQGEAGGVASGKEQYYSFDYANIHFVCVDSFTSDRSTNGPMLIWLRSDLAATDKDWIIAFWHHPPYSWGSHNSDGDANLVEMRELIVPILEAYGVDLVLSGHSHSYERSFLIDGHYGYSWQLQPEMILDGGLGGPDASHAYRKPAGGIGARKGAVYTVCGCSGAGGDSDPARHPAMALTHGGFGSMIIEINDLQLDARFLRPSMNIDDRFTIDKSVAVSIGPPLTISRGTNGAVISWPTSRPEFTLEWTPILPAVEWNSAPEVVETLGRQKVTSAQAGGGSRFFRLRERTSD